MLSVNDVRYYLQPQLTAAPEPSVWEQNWLPEDKRHPVNLILAVAPVGRFKIGAHVLKSAITLFSVGVGIFGLNSHFKWFADSTEIWGSLLDSFDSDRRVRLIHQLGSNFDSKSLSYLQQIFIDRRFNEAERKSAEATIDQLMEKSDLWGRFQKGNPIQKANILDDIKQYTTRKTVEDVLSLPEGQFEIDRGEISPVIETLLFMAGYNPVATLSALFDRNDLKRARQIIKHFPLLGFYDLKEADKLFIQGVVAMMEEKPDQAGNFFQKAIQVDSEFVAAHYYLSLLYFNRQDYSTATEFFQRAVKRGGDSLVMYDRAVSGALRNDDTTTAKILVNKFLSLNPATTTETLYYQALSHELKKEYSEAVSVFNQILKRDPKHLRAQYNRAYCRMQLGEEGQIKLAKSEFHQLVDQVESESRWTIRQRVLLSAAYHNLAFLEKQREPLVTANAEKFYEKGLSVYPTPALHNEYGDYLYKKNASVENRTKSLQHFNAALVLNPDFGLSLKNSAIVLSALGNFHQAGWVVQDMIDRKNHFSSEDISTLSALMSDNYFTLEDYKEAVVWAKEAVTYDPRNTYGYENLGNALLKLGDQNGAFQAFQKGLEYCDQYQPCDSGQQERLKTKLIKGEERR